LAEYKYTIRKAIASDLDIVNALASSHKKELGFVRKVTLANSIMHQELTLAQTDGQVVGFVRYHHRLDTQTTLYDIVVSPTARLAGIGKALIGSLANEASLLGKKTVVLKCPSELDANNFYSHIGFVRWEEEPGKKRSLIIWQLSLKS
jgi:N-acetylglutamate synthase-like GNAT family acetyltransferase